MNTPNELTIQMETPIGNVVSNLARKYEAITKGVKDNMGGNVLEYEAKDILRQGIAQGRTEGERVGEENGRLKMLVQNIEQIMKNLSVEVSEACRILGVTLEEYNHAKELCQ